MKVKIGIQGGPGSTNERAFREFVHRQGFIEPQIEYLLNTDPVIESVIAGEVDFGVFAFRSKSLLVQETLEALQKYGYQSVEIVDEVALLLDHALFQKTPIDKTKDVQVYSHLQALKIHERFLREQYGDRLHLIPEKDTALSVQKLVEGNYPPNSLAIGPVTCRHLYTGALPLISDLPGNHDYITKFWLVRKNPANV